MKNLKVLILMFVVGAMLAGCSNNKLSDAYDEEKLKADSKEIVAMIDEEKFDDVIARMSDKIATSISVEQIKEVWNPMKEKLGAFKKISKEVVVGNDNLATVVVVADFEGGKAQFTITYNEEMQLEALYLK
ncbi:DUF3887 domain-containing protein [Romboutsia weinsteinii]|uniref:DUF3887 domain-containing protein n=1 Tax=Romboutsia weinsteinii TaxID=2020949 RepID=A0A371IZ64_9FIRM|nr:DUF3887 domain-containing protein [Romboutsia weinsteinii]RDY25756.1 DUF3887 domain-containing protein [Romboutsia weinsteinii]